MRQKLKQLFICLFATLMIIPNFSFLVNAEDSTASTLKEGHVTVIARANTGARYSEDMDDENFEVLSEAILDSSATLKDSGYEISLNNFTFTQTPDNLDIFVSSSTSNDTVTNIKDQCIISGDKIIVPKAFEDSEITVYVYGYKANADKDFKINQVFDVYTGATVGDKREDREIDIFKNDTKIASAKKSTDAEINSSVKIESEKNTSEYKITSAKAYVINKENKVIDEIPENKIVVKDKYVNILGKPMTSGANLFVDINYESKNYSLDNPDSWETPEDVYHIFYFSDV